MPNRETRRSREWTLAANYVQTTFGADLVEFIADRRAKAHTWAEITRLFDGMPGGPPTLQTIINWFNQEEKSQ